MIHVYLFSTAIKLYSLSLYLEIQTKMCVINYEHRVIQQFYLCKHNKSAPKLSSRPRSI